MAKKVNKNLLIVAGVIATMLGISGIIPSVLKEVYLIIIISSIFLIGGIILLAFGLGD